jgi:uncharacterized protein (DUF4415 family)
MRSPKKTPPLDTNPEWQAADFSRAQAASEVLPSLFSTARTAALMKPRGRPKAEVIDHFKASGSGWQTRIDAALRQFITEHPSG